MSKILAAGLFCSAAAAACAQTTPTNPDLLSPPISQATPGGDANPSDTGVRAAVRNPPGGSAEQPGGMQAGQPSGRAHKGRHRLPH